MNRDRIWAWLRPALAVSWLLVFIFWPRLTLALTLLGVGSVFIAYNAFIFWRRVMQREQSPSVAPVVGGTAAAAGVALLPLDGAWQWAWIPLLLDWGGLPVLLGLWFWRDQR